MSGAGSVPASVAIYDTTCRDGSQLEGISLTVDDKMRICEQLDWLGVHYIEGGWPGANPKDDEFFRRAQTGLHLESSTLVAFGSTRRPKGKVDSDPTLLKLVEAKTSHVCIVGKCWDYHVTEALRVELDEGVAMVADSVAFLAGAGLDVMFDAEHFFDGYRGNPEFALRVLEAAATAGVSHLVLCDTNGGSLPTDVRRGGGGRDRVPRCPGRNPSSRRLWMWGCQCPRWRAWRRIASAGHDQRLRRANRQRQPHHHHPELDAQDGRRGDPGRSAGATDPCVASHCRAMQHGTRSATAVRRNIGIRSQSGASCVGHRQEARRLRNTSNLTP